MKFILASSSPRRREILTALGTDFEVIVSDTDESSDITIPERLTEELARRKAEAVLPLAPSDRAVISCDTVVYIDGEILGKPHCEAQAYSMLRKLSGRTHTVVSGICISYGGKTITAHEKTEVTFSPMTDGDIEKCVKYGNPYDKAGGYAVQGIASLWISGISGDYFNVVGLPAAKLQKTMTEEFGFGLV